VIFSRATTWSTRVVSRSIIAAAIALPSSVASRDEWFVINCGWEEIRFPAKPYPLGLPLSNKELCRCSKRGWRGEQCDMAFLNQLLFFEMDRKNDLIVEKVLQGVKEYPVEH